MFTTHYENRKTSLKDIKMFYKQSNIYFDMSIHEIDEIEQIKTAGITDKQKRLL